MNELSAWLDGVAARVFALSATLFVLLNVGAVALVFLRRDRGLVNRWTARWLGANLLLLGAGVGMPLTAKVVRMAVDALSAAQGLTSQGDEEASVPEERPQR